MKGYDDYDAKKIICYNTFVFHDYNRCGLFFTRQLFWHKFSATEKLKTQISALEENTSSLTDTKNDLESQINDLNSELSTKTTVNNYFMEAKKKNDELKNDITELNQKSSELDSQIEELQNQNSSLQATEKTGKTYTLKKDQSYTCPS